MKLLVGITLGCLLVGNAAARGGGGGHSMGSGGFRGGFGRVFPSRVGSFPGSIFRSARWNQFGNAGVSSGFFGGGFVDSDFGYPVDYGFPASDQSQSPPIVVVTPPPPPPQPANPVIREYHWKDADTGSAVFSIVTNDHAVHEARLVWSDGKLLKFTRPTGGTGQVPWSSVSRDLTHQANPGKNLMAWLP